MMKKAVIWNSISGMLNAGQSALIILVITHFLGVESAGVFSIAYAIANFGYAFARFGVRNFQVTDIFEKYRFSTYMKMRCITVSASIIVCVIYLLYCYFLRDDELIKLFVVLGVFLWKMIDATEDVFYGMYQQKGRLDIGARLYSFRLAISTTLFCVLIFSGFELIEATIGTLTCSVIVSIILIRKSISRFQIPVTERYEGGNVWQLFHECISLCVGTSLSMYIGNAPKYIIDQCMDETVQGYFGILIMPAFVIMILNNFIYQPIVHKLGKLWNEKNYNAFAKRVALQYGAVLLLTLVVVVVGSLIGLPILSWLYGVHLESFRITFILLLVGGGIYALVSFAIIPITTMRFQNCISIGFAIVSIATFLFGKVFVNRWGMNGAAILYICINSLLAIYLLICYSYKLRKESRANSSDKGKEP